MKRAVKGFTLIELLVVVAIIAVLIAILIPALANAKRLSLQTQCGANFKGIGSAMSLFNADFGRIPIAGRGANFQGAAAAAAISTGIRIVFWNNFYPTLPSQTDPETGTPVGRPWTGLPNALASYIGGNRSKLLVCPATQSINCLASTDATGVQLWDRLVAGGTLGTSNYPAWVTNYDYFMGDPGNSLPIVGNFYFQVSGSGNSLTPTAVTYDELVTPIKVETLTQNMILAQDSQYWDPAALQMHGNHPAMGAGTLVADAYQGPQIYTTGYYTGNNVTDISGSNVLFGDFHVEFKKTTELTQVAASSPSAILFLGGKNYK